MVSRFVRALVCLGVSGICFSTEAGTVEQAHLLAEPQMLIKAGAINSCGFGVRGYPKDLSTTRPVVVVDASLVLYSTGIGMVKAGASQIAWKDGKTTEPANRPISDVWLLGPDGEPTTPLEGKVLAASDPGYILFGMDVAKAIALFNVVLEGGQLTVGFRVKGEAVDRIYAGTVATKAADREQSMRCLAGLLKSMDAAMKAAAKEAAGQ